MSIAQVVTAGFGNGTFSGTIKDVVTRGYDISTIIPPVIPPTDGIAVSGAFGDGVTTSGAFGDGALASGAFGTGATVRGRL
jgi:hypothetical protein